MHNKIAYSIAEVVQLTDFSRSEVYRLLASGKLKARKYGRKTVILATDLDAFLGSLPEGVAEPPERAMAARAKAARASAPYADKPQEKRDWLTEREVTALGVNAAQLTPVIRDGRPMYFRVEVEQLAGGAR